MQHFQQGSNQSVYSMYLYLLIASAGSRRHAPHKRPNYSPVHTNTCKKYMTFEGGIYGGSGLHRKKSIITIKET